MKEKILKGILSFFVIMFCCTLTARGAASVTVAKVMTEEMKRGKLTKSFSGSGEIVAGDKNFQSLPEGQKVARILVSAGSEIKKGQPVVQLDLSYLEQQMAKKNREIEKMKLTLLQQEIEENGSARVPATAQAELALTEAQSNLEAAEQNCAQAEADYEAYAQQKENTVQAEDGAEEEGAAEEAAVQTLTGEAAGVQTAAEENVSGQMVLEGYTAQEFIQQKERLDAAAAEVETAKRAYEQAQQAYNLAQQEETAQQANEATQRERARLSGAAAQLDMEALLEESGRLEQLQKAKGIVTAQSDGILELVQTQEGALTTGTEQIILQTGSVEACGVLPPGQTAVAEVGDEVQIRIQGDTQSLPVSIGRFGKDQDGNNVWYGKIEGGYRAGTAFSYEYSESSPHYYESLIPLGALHEERGMAYVLTAEVRPGILGESYVAVKIPVTVLEKDGENAAIQTTLSREARIITQSGKYVKEGDRVRLSN